VDFEDRLSITTAEGVDVELTLAGLGSRFAAALVDAVIQTVLLVALVGVFAGFGWLGGWGAAAYAVASFLVLFGYDVAFEVLASGRTLGKRWNGLRVVLVGGYPIGFTASAIRNLLRLVDFLPSAYLVGCASILVTARNQRLGDLAAGTLVVRERRGTTEPPPLLTAPAEASPHAGWDVSGITAGELATVRSFLERRDTIDLTARRQLGHTLAERLRPKVTGAPPELGGERFLEALLHTKTQRSVI
jgi:uncharacterized RDD family membrane protein YckC